MFYMPHDYNNLGGKHAWVSGSTIKYVNMWLEEGASKLHFTNIEKFPSIELPTIDEREPYVSYPTGVTFMVWSSAKLLGKDHIDISFLKHFQLIMYGIECLLLALIVYVFCSRTLELNEKCKVFISVVITTIWMTLPVNNWFLTNIYWVDMAVFLWIMAYLLLESLIDWEILSPKTKGAICCLRSLVIAAGVLTEYFFWIVVFAGFVFNIFFVEKKDGRRRFCDIVKSSLGYVIPVILALGIFLWQISYTKDWLVQILDTFLHRTGASNSENITGKFWENFQDAITANSKMRALLLVFVVIMLLALTAVAKIKHEKIITNRSIAVVVIMIIAPAIQLRLFWNHSSIHHYALVKVGIQIVGILMGIIATVPIVLKSTRHKEVLRISVVSGSMLLMLLALGIPGRIRGYYQEKNTEPDYSIDFAIFNNTGYEDVCFSYTYSIPNNPPMDLSVSEKLVYIIGCEEDMATMFDALPQNARKILVIDKTGNGSNAFTKVEKTKEIESAELTAIQSGETIYEDEKCILVRMHDE